MQYPREEDTEGCMKIDVIEELIREVQEEEGMSKLQAKQARKNGERKLDEQETEFWSNCGQSPTPRRGT
ncbi:hypothetical protein PIB30_090055, partial [Stylosanthes scabra]|nr:hypothetical protein [Stylosanthes scabra]